MTTNIIIFDLVFWLPVNLFFFFFFLAPSNVTCKLESCSPQSCGNFHNIRCPFTLKGANNPHKCSTPIELVCDDENNRLLIYSSTPPFFKFNNFYVLNISYGEYGWIQIVDPGLQKDNCSSLPRYSLSPRELRNSYLTYLHSYESILFYMNCSTRVDSPYYVDTSPCINSSSNNAYYTYVVSRETKIKDLKDSCRIWMVSGTDYLCSDLFKNHSYLDIHNQISNGFMLYWYLYGNTVACIPKESADSEVIRRDDTPTEPEIYMLKIMSIGSSIGLFFVFLVATLLIIRTCTQIDKNEKEKQLKIEKFLESYKDLTPTRYSYADIKKMTNKFQRQLGGGGYGSVYEGKLTNGIPVAVKVLNDSQSNGEDFINEVGTIGRIHHKNVVRLLGFCADGFRRALIYEYMPKESLEKFIFSSGEDKNPFFGWEKLQGISIGIARGIEYLHQGCEQRILHFDIKPHNILLDHKYNPKISDFGLAKLCSKGDSIVSMTAARGTMGYIAPEVFSRNFGNVSTKSDVYSFGMLLLEMVGGRKNIDVMVDKASQVYFPEWIYSRLEQGKELGIKVDTKEDATIARKLATAALWCIQWNPVDRPSMKSVIQMLEGNSENLIMPPNPFTSSTSAMTSTTIPGKLQQQIELKVIEEEPE